MSKIEERILAIFLADIHLSLKPPVWRSAEPDWLEIQRRVLNEIQNLHQVYNCPVICAGDIFDKWNTCPELINLALAFLPDNMYAIPGQHDLPLHQIEDIHRSAYWTLVKAGKITDFSKDLINISSSQLTLYGFPYDKSLTPLDCKSKFIQIAVVHDYVWIPEYSYPDAPIEKRLSVHKKEWLGYNIVVYGDNHKGFLTTFGGTKIFNCGTLMRRKSDEIDYRPQVGLLLESGEVVPHYLDISKDKYLDIVDIEEKPDLDMTGFIEGLEKLGKTALDFRDAMKEFLHRGGTSDEAKQIILEAMEKE